MVSVSAPGRAPPAAGRGRAIRRGARRWIDVVGGLHCGEDVYDQVDAAVVRSRGKTCDRHRGMQTVRLAQRVPLGQERATALEAGVAQPRKAEKAGVLDIPRQGIQRQSRAVLQPGQAFIDRDGRTASLQDCDECRAQQQADGERHHELHQAEPARANACHAQPATGGASHCIVTVRRSRAPRQRSVIA